MASSKEDVVKLLKPEFEHLRREMRQVEARIITKILTSRMDSATEQAGEGAQPIEQIDAS